MTVNYAAQHLLVFWSAAVGVALSIFYDCFRLLRALGIRSRFAVFIQDVVFCIASALAYILLIFNLTDGVIRFYAFVIIAAAFLLWHFTIGRLFMACVDRIKAFLRAVYRKLYRAVKRLYGKFAEHRRGSAAKERKIHDKKNRRERNG